MTEAEKKEIKAMLDAGFISLDEYNSMMGKATSTAETVTSPSDDMFAQSIEAQDVAEWHVAINGQAQRPFNKQTLANMLASGQLKRDTNIWKQGMAAWDKAANVMPSFVESLVTQPPQPTVERQALSAADIESLYDDAMSLYFGGHYEKAIVVIRKLADGGYVPAQASLGDFYDWGKGVEQNYVEALVWHLLHKIALAMPIILVMA